MKQECSDLSDLMANMQKQETCQIRYTNIYIYIYMYVYVDMYIYICI